MLVCLFVDNFQEIVADVAAHEQALDQLESAVNDVITLVDESDQSDLSSRFQSVSLHYRCHAFQSQCYPVWRWLDDRSLQLCSMPPCAVLVTQLQVHTCIYIRTCIYMCMTNYSKSFEDMQHNRKTKQHNTSRPKQLFFKWLLWEGNQTHNT